MLSAERKDGTPALLLSPAISLFQIILSIALARGTGAIDGFILLGLVGSLA